MKTCTSILSKHICGSALKPALLLAAVIGLAGSTPLLAAESITIYPPDSKPYGRSYGEWAAEFWKWGLALPLENHPFLPNAADPYYDFSYAQYGKVWFWSSPDGPTNRVVTMPADKALFLTIRDVDTSTLEPDPFYGATEEDQRANSNWFADHIEDVFCVINGVPVENITDYRFETPQFKFKAPTPWIFAETGGKGTAVGDGYFLMLELPQGQHTIHYGGTFRFTMEEDGFDAEFPKDITIHLTVE
jgi:hypothetical protein